MAGHPVPSGPPDLAGRIEATQELLLFYRPGPRRGTPTATVEALITEALRRLASDHRRAQEM